MQVNLIWKTAISFQTEWEFGKIHEIEWLQFLLELSKVVMAMEKGGEKPKQKQFLLILKYYHWENFARKHFWSFFLVQIIGSFWLIITIDFIIWIYDTCVTFTY